MYNCNIIRTFNQVHRCTEVHQRSIRGLSKVHKIHQRSVRGPSDDYQMSMGCPLEVMEVKEVLKQIDFSMYKTESLTVRL